MQYRFIIQKNQDGTMSSDCATVCEVLKEQNWLHQGETPYQIQLRTFEAMKRDMFPYLTDPDVFEVPVGSIEFVEAYLRKMYGIEKMVPLLVPIQLDIPEYLGRKDALVCSKSELRDKASEWGAEEVFLKSASQLKCDYTGVYDIRKDTITSDKEM